MLLIYAAIIIVIAALIDYFGIRESPIISADVQPVLHWGIWLIAIGIACYFIYLFFMSGHIPHAR